MCYEVLKISATCHLKKGMISKGQSSSSFPEHFSGAFAVRFCWGSKPWIEKLSMMSLVKSCESTLSLEKNMVIAIRNFSRKSLSGHVCKIDADGKLIDFHALRKRVTWESAQIGHQKPMKLWLKNHPGLFPVRYISWWLYYPVKMGLICQYKDLPCNKIHVTS